MASFSGLAYLYAYQLASGEHLYRGLGEARRERDLEEVARRVATAVIERESDRRRTELRSEIGEKRPEFSDAPALGKAGRTLMDTIEAYKRENKRAAAQRVSGQANVFGKEARRYYSRSHLWLIGMALPAVAMFGIALESYRSPPVLTAENIGGYLSGRVLLASLLFTLLIWGMRNYRADYHNHVVNRHRATALTLYVDVQELLLEANASELLTEVVRSMIAPQSSGYGGNDDGVGGPLKIVNNLTERPGD